MASQYFVIAMVTAKQLKVNAGAEAGADVGPLISPEAKERVCSLIQSGVDEGAKVSRLLHLLSDQVCVCLLSSWPWMEGEWWCLGMNRGTL